MPKERIFYAPQLALQPLADDLEQWLKNRDFETQVMPVEGGGMLIQARREEGWRQVLGMALATNVVVSRAGPNIKVECGQGKWLDKAVVGAVGLLLLWPAMIPAAVGAWQQSKLPDEIFDQVASYIARQPQGQEMAAGAAAAAPVTGAPAGVQMTQCPNCGGSVAVGAKFCEHCGQRLPEVQAEPQPQFCAQCGAELSPGAKFCSECGTRVGEKEA
ncbi:MAG: zinc ribbon domain-containing protein [Chloroflexi bacterium]|nr:zinc ribbon domain-containing protein [Chloroflexota bacterium]